MDALHIKGKTFHLKEVPPIEKEKIFKESKTFLYYEDVMYTLEEFNHTSSHLQHVPATPKSNAFVNTKMDKREI